MLQMSSTKAGKSITCCSRTRAWFQNLFVLLHRLATMIGNTHLYTVHFVMQTQCPWVAVITYEGIRGVVFAGGGGH